MSISSNNPNTKISAGGVDGFGASLSILNPELSPCGDRFAFDQYGRPAAPDSLNTTVCAGRYDPMIRIEVENSLRSYASPRYYNIPQGLTGQGTTDTMFGRRTSAGRNFLDTQQKPLNISEKLQQENINPDLVLTRLAEKESVYSPASYLHYENHYKRY